MMNPNHRQQVAPLSRTPYALFIGWPALQPVNCLAEVCVAYRSMQLAWDQEPGQRNRTGKGRAHREREAGTADQ